MKSIVVYCGANPGNQAIFAEQAAELGRTLAAKNIQIVFGGGSVGLMGAVATAALAAGGQVKGIITHQLKNLELAHPEVETMVSVETMSERRVLLLADTNGVITLPGGYGSMDELFEALTLAQLHQYQHPIGLLNVAGYYDPLLAMLDQMVKFGFLKPQNRLLCLDAPTIPELLEKMENYRYNAIDKWL